MSLIQVDGLSVRYGARTALSDVSLRIEPNEIVTIVGPNGSGKTSLLRAIIGAVKPLAGSIVHASNLKIGYVPQKLHIDETLPITVSRFLRLQKVLGTQDVACVIDAKHLCVNSRGIRDIDSSTVTAEYGGAFKEAATRKEFINFLNLPVNF